MDVIDTPLNGLRTADILFEAHNVYFERVLESMTLLPFESKSIDYVVFNASYHHSPDDRKTLEECFRILRPGGRVLLLQEFSSLARRIRLGDVEDQSVEAGSSHHDVDFSDVRRHARSLGFGVKVSPSENLRGRLQRRLGRAAGSLCFAVLEHCEFLLRPLSLSCVTLEKA